MDDDSRLSGSTSLLEHGVDPNEFRHYCYLAANDDVICMACVVRSRFVAGYEFANEVKAKYED
jgi:hypothetical protein